MDKEAFKRYGYAFIDWLADYQEGLERFPVKSRVEPGEIKGQLPVVPPSEPEAMDQIFSDFQQIVVPGITHWQHPGWFAYFPANTSPPSILAELLTAGLGAQCMVWQTSPAATELEEVVMEWLRQMLQLPEGWKGVIQDTASTATLCALLTAREVATEFSGNTFGVQKPLTVYASEEAHSSIEKGIKIAGFGKTNLRLVPTDRNFAMLPEKLEELIKRDKTQGLTPACVVASVGTTSSTAVDPLKVIGEICRRHRLFLHVDAAFSGTAAILPEKRSLLSGVEYADSFVFNPHKWMFTNFDCSAYFVKDPTLLTRTFEIHPEYLKTGVDAQVSNFRDWGIQLGRRFRALKLWFVIRSYGVEGLRSILREHLRLAEQFKEWVTADPRFELMAPVSVSLVCFRLNDGNRSEEDLTTMNRELLERINATGQAFLTHTVLRGRYAIRMVIASRLTEERHVRATWDFILEQAESVLGKYRKS
ncbi:MAG TPA: pyridoxal-dependent decarboxylase [Atribacteraceae bacterium]|nr:pyridoxal-dependent decarboxylase [Atribacteraceae bacterium]